MANIKELDPGIPTSTAWQSGPRLYVRCPYASRLDTDLRNLGAHWDGTQRALWIGSTKKAAVIEVIRASMDRKAAVQAVKDAGRWVQIPYDAHEIREHAKERLNAVYGGNVLKGWWAMRTDEHLAEVQGMVKSWQEEAQAARKAEEKARRENAAAQEAAAAKAAQQAAQVRRAQILERSGRTSAGETAELREISTRRMNKATAQDAARSAGSLVRLEDGRRGIVTDVKVWFTNAEMASSVCWHAETHDEAHWDFAYTVAVVETTDDEREQDAKAEAEAQDAAELDDLIEQATALTAPRTEGWTYIAEEDRAGQITVHRGVTRFASGTLTLTRDDRVIWQHPGWYDDYIATEGTTTAPDVVDRVRRLITAGPRERSHNRTGQQRAYFTVTTQEDRA
ncbi:hypothetical protein [Streptomyces botrytidirepellens]|uniref:Uncharacterized protein n=1 Tax=Streptomyces botrytidirepellens TaxID=2486417 RepID=A0A3M8X7C1_9ACTN|nr:hypothetical protein [Streptomyces botrytidirepellens]RNG38027.1 hypothetical protein EEJ42_01920 [Streptomyces botrytidirepellens]